MPDDLEAATPVVFRNDTARFGWALMGLWVLMLGLFTYILVRDGGGDQPLLPLILLLFYLFGAAGCAFVYRQPRVRVEVWRGSVVTRETYPWRSREDRFATSDVGVSQVLEDKDSEGDPYFKCALRLPGDRSLVFAENGLRADVEAKRAQMLAALAAA